MIKRIILASVAAVVIVALGVAPAFAEGYNDDGTGKGLYTRAAGFFSGPHGGYTTTTNKCADCHSTHYAEGSYKLLRANTREAACDYCHGGGGGSTINIMMDNEYRTGTFSKTEASAITSDSMGFGTGHTLGYKGLAPTDIKPAYSDPEGFACFDCHTPHGNSARVMTTMSNPGRSFVGPGQQGRPSTTDLNSSAANWPIKAGFGTGDQDALLEPGEWGIDETYGNFVWDGSPAAGMQFRYRPIWPSGRWLLLKNAHGDIQETKTDTTVAGFDETATAGINKYAINWTEPLGPADGNYGGGQDNDNDNNFPFAMGDGIDANSPDGTGGFLALSEFCVDCHDGAAGASTQKAEVFRSTDDTYAVAFSHDAQPRH